MLFFYSSIFNGLKAGILAIGGLELLNVLIYYKDGYWIMKGAVVFLLIYKLDVSVLNLVAEKSL